VGFDEFVLRNTHHTKVTIMIPFLLQKHREGGYGLSSFICTSENFVIFVLFAVLFVCFTFILQGIFGSLLEKALILKYSLANSNFLGLDICVCHFSCDFFFYPCTVLWLTQSLTEMSSRNISWEGKRQPV